MNRKQSNTLETVLSADDFCAFDDVTGAYPLHIDAVYADANHPRNIFQTALYRSDAKIWCHKDLFKITLKAAELCYQQSGLLFEIKDALRPIEAQQKMQDTPIVKANPQWCAPPLNLLSRPGEGGHPRGMAVDIILIDQNGDAVDMGTPFDFFTEDPHDNPAARNFTGFAPDILERRTCLEQSMIMAAQEQEYDILPLPQEWWDFRFYPKLIKTFAPMSDHDLPKDMKIVNFGK